MTRNRKNSKKMKVEIHCPVSDCVFAEGSERHFTEKKFLNQHIAKVHADKKYSCAKCQKSFGLDWWRKYHEKTCGMVWKCDCGVEYTARESLLTHVRRTRHKLPDCVIMKDKTKLSKAAPKPSDNPIILLIQPIIQNITCTHDDAQPPPTSVITQRRILPKMPQPLFLPLPLPISVTTPGSIINNSSLAICEQTNENILFNSVHPLTSSEMPTYSIPVKDPCTDTSIVETTHSPNIHKTVATQTTDDAGVSVNRRQSQASQCCRRKPKSSKVGIESHTQTSESAVIKIKKKRSRRKSVAITTEKSMLTDQMLGPDNFFWPGFKDFVLQHADSLGARLFKNSTSTQTSIMTNSKTLCDSETLTDSEIVKFPWEMSLKVDTDNKSNTQLQLLRNIATSNEISVGIDSHNLQELNIFGGNTLNNFTEGQASKETSVLSGSLDAFSSAIASTHPVNIPGTSSDININPGTITQTDNDTDIIIDTSNIQNTGNVTSNTFKNMPAQNCSIFSVFGDCDKSSIDNKVSVAPTLSDIHTQTIASEVLDYNLLTNMETQTTDDFNFSYWEFSDTETQTPWEDFPNIDDSPLKTDQLSIEIQTDFSSFDPELNLDPYDLINSVDMHNMVAGCSSKETAGVNTETQTLDKFYFPQFTNSECQTLDISDFMFDA